jgi:glyoxylase-like metal-dependent hydrolase (beta-lactamase superfamily II)
MRYHWRVLRAGTFKLDAGSMFGLIPRVVWSRNVPVDDRGRMTVRHNCVLLESEANGPQGRPIRALIETGSGDKPDAKSREIFELGPWTITDALRAAGVEPEQLDAVLVTHLHFDHAGGLTRLARPQETPDWSGPGWAGDVAVVRTFPNAKVWAQAREWDDAMANRSVMTRTYFRDHLEPIRPQLRLVDSPRPFPAGYTPGREEPPPSDLSVRLTETIPGVRVFLAPGHTWGQQGVMFEDVRGRRVVFTPDVMPTVHHLGAAFSLGYDVEPYTSMVTRTWLLREAAAKDLLLVLDHEPGNPCVRVRANAKKWYDLVPEPPGEWTEVIESR